MNKEEIIAFFDQCAATWDAHMVKDDSKLNLILDAAGVTGQSAVLDVACGTGVLVPYYLQRGATKVLGVDISPEMTRIAQSKLQDPRVEIICGDIEECPVLYQVDCCVVYNALPHFPEPARLIERLAKWVKPGGRLTVAHGMGRKSLKEHHRGRAEHVSIELLSAEKLAELMAGSFLVDETVDDEEMYIVAGIKSRR